MTTDPIRLLYYTALALHRGECRVVDLPAELKSCPPVYSSQSSLKPGDLVVEVSSAAIAEKEQKWSNRIGRLITVQKELVPVPESSGYVDTFHYIEGLDGCLYRWSNCELLPIYEKLPWRLEPANDKSEWVAEARKRHEIPPAKIHSVYKHKEDGRLIKYGSDEHSQAGYYGWDGRDFTTTTPVTIRPSLAEWEPI